MLDSQQMCQLFKMSGALIDGEHRTQNMQIDAKIFQFDQSNQ